MSDVNLETLSQRAREALVLAMKGRPITVETLKTIGQRDIWILPRFGRKTSNEIKDWLASIGINMPEDTRY